MATKVLDDIVRKALGKGTVLLSVCTHRTIDIDCLTAVMGLFGKGKHSVTWCPIRGDALIDRSRSRVASYFLEQRDEDILVFIDDDIVFSAEDFEKIVTRVVRGCDIAGGMYVTKGELGKTCVLFDGDDITFKKDAKIKEVEAISTGFMAIHRRVFEKMREEKVVPKCHQYYKDLTFYPFFQPFPMQKNGQYVYLSEDWAFCQRARELGFKVWIDPSIFLGHKGEYIYTLGDKVRLNSKKLSLPELAENFEITLK